jgi:hypothetical protein
MPDELATTAVIPRPRSDTCPAWCTDHDPDSDICATTKRLTFTDAGPSAAAVKTIAIHITAETGHDPKIQLSINGGGDNELSPTAATALAFHILDAAGAAQLGRAL